MLLAALLHRLPRDVPSRFLLLVRPDTVLRWHRDALARRPAARSRPKTSTVWEILQQAGIDPAPARAPATWASFLRSQAGALLACDFSGDRYLNRSPPVRAGGHRALHPADPDPGRDRSSGSLLGGARAAAPLRPLPEPMTDPEQIAHLGARRRDRLGGTLREYRHTA